MQQVAVDTHLVPLVISWALLLLALLLLQSWRKGSTLKLHSPGLCSCSLLLTEFVILI